MAGKSKKMMETAAVYWEPKVKTYGFQEVFNVSLLEATVPVERITHLGSFFQSLDESGITFHLTFVQPLNDHTACFCLVFDRKWENNIQKGCKAVIRKDKGESFLVRSPVELVYFFGPHFGDRYGIADTTFQLFSKHNISILASGCSGSAVYLVLPEKGIEKIRPVLSSAFEVPKTK